MAAHASTRTRPAWPDAWRDFAWPDPPGSGLRAVARASRSLRARPLAPSRAARLVDPWQLAIHAWYRQARARLSQPAALRRAGVVVDRCGGSDNLRVDRHDPWRTGRVFRRPGRCRYQLRH